MTLQSFKDRVKGPALAAGLGAAMLGAFSTAVHADPTYTSLKVKYSTNVGEVSSQALNYSQKTGGIGILMSYGPFKGSPSIEGAGQKLVQMFEDKGVKAAYFIRLSEKPGLSITYATQDTGIGPMPPKEAIKRIDEAIALNDVAKSANADLAYNQY